MSKPYPKKFRDDVVRVARNRGPEVDLEQIAKDFGIHITGKVGSADDNAATAKWSLIYSGLQFTDSFS